MLDDAFMALKKMDWGTDLAPLSPLEAAVAASHGQSDLRKDLESRLLAAINSDVSRDAKDYICRKLTQVGTAAAVPALAALLTDKEQSHMARFALEQIAGAEASQALRDSLAKVSGKLKVGVISSIGARRDAAAVSMLGTLLADSDANVSRAAAVALGAIGTLDAVKALQAAKPAAAETKQASIDAQFACAESLLSENKTSDARAVYKSLVGSEQPKLVRLAATRGMLACAAKDA